MTVDDLWFAMQVLKDKGHGGAPVLLDIAVDGAAARACLKDAVLVESLVRNVEVVCLRSYQECLEPKPAADGAARWAGGG